MSATASAADLLRLPDRGLLRAGILPTCSWSTAIRSPTSSAADRRHHRAVFKGGRLVGGREHSRV